MGRLLAGLLIAALAVGCGRRTLPSGDGPVIDAPDIARVVCADNGTRLETPVVEVQADGIHIRVRNEASVRLSFAVGDIGGGNAEGEQVWPIPPGAARVGCWKDTADDPDWVSLEVVDPQRVWVSPELECQSETAVSGEGDYGTPPKGDPRDPVELAREFFENIAGPLGPDDVVEPAGYPEAEIRQVRLARDRRVVAVADYADASFAGGQPGSGWISEGYQACGDL